MGARLPLRLAVRGAVLSLIITASVSGCTLFGPRNQPQAPPTRPAPTRPTGERTGVPLRPAPTKRLPGVSAVNTAGLKTAVERCRSAVNKNDWAMATKEADRLGTTWTRFKPSSARTVSAAEMKTFDMNYVKLQKDVRTRNKSGCISSLRALSDSVNKMGR